MRELAMIGEVQINSTDSPRLESARRMLASREELVERLACASHEDGIIELLPGVQLYRISNPTELAHGMTIPAFCVIAQGSKDILLGENRFHYDPSHYLIASAALPAASRIVEASPAEPYLGLVIRLDPTLVGSVMVEAGYLAPRDTDTVRALNVSKLDAGLLDATVRLVRLLDTPRDARFLVPHVTREIVYLLLKGEQGGRLVQITALAGGTTHRIAAAVERLRQDFDRPLRIEDLALELGMSVSNFYQHFKEVTAMSPLQFQKQLRLQEARRLLLTEDVDAAGVGRRVGYDDASHFTREYKRLFGTPPQRHAAGLRSAVGSAGI